LFDSKEINIDVNSCKDYNDSLWFRLSGTSRLIVREAFSLSNLTNESNDVYFDFGGHSSSDFYGEFNVTNITNTIVKNKHLYFNVGEYSIVNFKENVAINTANSGVLRFKLTEHAKVNCEKSLNIVSDSSDDLSIIVTAFSELQVNERLTINNKSEHTNITVDDQAVLIVVDDFIIDDYSTKHSSYGINFNIEDFADVLVYDSLILNKYNNGGIRFSMNNNPVVGYSSFLRVSSDFIISFKKDEKEGLDDLLFSMNRNAEINIGGNFEIYSAFNDSYEDNQLLEFNDDSQIEIKDNFIINKNSNGLLEMKVESSSDISVNDTFRILNFTSDSLTVSFCL